MLAGRVFFRLSTSYRLSGPRLLSSVATPAYDVARQLLEESKTEEAHEVVTEAIAADLKIMNHDSEDGGAMQRLPLLTLELGKSFLQQNEPQDALAAFEHSVRLFDDNVYNNVTDDDSTPHERYLEAMLHLAKLQSLSGQGNPEHLWKRSISYSMKHLGRDSYQVLVASLGLAEFYLELLRLEDADKYAAASIELAKQLPLDKMVRQRLVEGLTMQGLARVQRQEVDEGIKFYEDAIKELEALDENSGEMDNWTRTALYNLYRNMEHAFKSIDQEDKAKEWKAKRDDRLMTMQDVTLDEPSAVKNKL